MTKHLITILKWLPDKLYLLAHGRTRKSEFQQIEDGFDKLPAMRENANRPLDLSELPPEELLARAKATYPILTKTIRTPRHVEIMRRVGHRGGYSKPANEALLAYIRRFEPKYPDMHAAKDEA